MSAVAGLLLSAISSQACKFNAAPDALQASAQISKAGGGIANVTAPMTGNCPP